MVESVLFNLIILGVGIFILLRSGVYVVRSISAMARYLRFSEFVLSFMLLAFATSLAEFSVGINAALSGVPELSLGDILGTNIVNLALVLGLVSIIGGELELKDYKHFKEGRVITLLFIMSPIFLLLDGTLSRLDGIFLLAFAVLNAIRMIGERDIVMKRKTLRHHMEPHAAHSVESKKDFIKKVGLFVVSVPLLVASAYGMVFSITNISEIIGVPEFLIGLFVVGIGTSLPELSVGIRSVKTDKDGVSLGNLFGASVINSTLVLGVVSVIAPIELTRYSSFAATGVFILVIIAASYFFLRRKKYLTRKEGFVLIALYISFLLVQSFILGI